MIRPFAYALVACALLGGCSRSESAQPSKKLAKYVLEQAPADVGTKLDVSFDGRVTLLGARLEPSSTVTSDDKVTLTLYWRSEAPVDDDVRLSTHLLDGAGKQIQEIDFVGPLRKRDEQVQKLGPGRWKPGKVYVDKQVFKAPSAKRLKTEKFEIAVSLADGEERLPIVRGAHDTQNRVKVGEVVVKRRKAPARAKAGVARAGSAKTGTAPAASVSSSSIAPTKAPTKTAEPKLPPVKVPLKPPATPPSESKR